MINNGVFTSTHRYVALEVGVRGQVSPGQGKMPEGQRGYDVSYFLRAGAIATTYSPFTGSARTWAWTSDNEPA